MKTAQQSKELYQKANEQLSLINHAWQNPGIDNLSLLFCQGVKECMYNFLRCFLMIKKSKIKSTDNLGDLVNQCAAIDDRFKQIDLRWIVCKEHHFKTEADIFCTSTQQVQICTWIANGIKKLVDDEIKKTGVPFA